jgi:hypothetical protein
MLKDLSKYSVADLLRLRKGIKFDQERRSLMRDRGRPRKQSAGHGGHQDSGAVRPSGGKKGLH